MRQLSNIRNPLKCPIFKAFVHLSGRNLSRNAFSKKCLKPLKTLGFSNGDEENRTVRVNSKTLDFTGF